MTRVRWPLWLSWAAAVGALVHVGQSYLWPQEAWYALLAAFIWAATPLPRPQAWVTVAWALWTAAGVTAAFVGVVPSVPAMLWGVRGDLILASGLLVGGWLATRNEQQIRPEWAAPWLLVAAVAVGQGALQAAGVLRAPFDPYGALDAAGGLGLSNFTSEWAAVATLLAVALLPQVQRRRAGTIAGVAVALFALWAKARTALAALLLGGATILGHRRRRGAIAVAAAVLLVGGAGAWLMLNDVTGTYRALLWRDGLAVVTKAPMGAGPGGFSRGVDLVISPQLDQRSWERNVSLSHAHNLAIETVAERGLLGLVALALLALAALRGAWRRRADARMVWVAGATVAWTAAAMTSLVRPVPAMWWLGGVALGWMAAAAPAIPQTAAARRGIAALRALAVTVAVAVAVAAWHEALTDRLARNALAAAAAERPADAERDLLAATARAPRNEALWFNMALVRLRMKDTGGAIDALQRAGQIRPTWARPYEVLTVIALEAGQWRIAQQAAEHWYGLPGTVATDVYRAAAIAHATSQDYDAAWRMLDAGLKQAPGDLELMRIKARLLGLQERWSEASELFAVILENPQATERDRRRAKIAREQAER